MMLQYESNESPYRRFPTGHGTTDWITMVLARIVSIDTLLIDTILHHKHSITLKMKEIHLMGHFVLFS
jgi:hypothetical protein